MDSSSFGELEACKNDFATAIQTVVDYIRETAGGAGFDPVSPPRQTIPSDAPGYVHRARADILNITGRLQTLLAEPTFLIQSLASRTQLLACVKWLCEFQILASIPVSGGVPAKDVADLAGVPETQLRRVVRMTATAGFLFEPQPGYIAHTALSAPFVTNLSYLDATIFLAETAVPASLQMAKGSATSSIAGSRAPTVSFNLSETKLQRQWSAYQWCTGDQNDGITEMLSRLNWHSLKNACVVDVCASSTRPASALAIKHPMLRFVVQICEIAQEYDPADTETTGQANDKILVQKRTHAAVQQVKNAAVYILRLNSPSHSFPTQIRAELKAHLDVLSANSSATLILVPRLLPEPKSVDPHQEALARLRDLSRQQLTNECDLELGEASEIVQSVHDSRGGLVVVNKLRSRNSRAVALEVRYKGSNKNHQSLG
ncbi:hypothetical protein EV356DRAFT_449295 [Viridothelium virens]|uniref:O-methyltransferase family protein n=1 Tax=Viridothelium virens TaxID=1048519 RepID=A0A6A6H4D9_VIRVR|nr:hypothetical protein EV356DRAFT_449295 [Viridothelium virens]